MPRLSSQAASAVLLNMVTGLEKTRLTEAPEVSVWISFMWCLKSVREYVEEYAGPLNGERSIVEINACLTDLADIAEATLRFNVVLPVIIDVKCTRQTEHEAILKIEFSPSLWRWYNWWDDYMSELPREDRQHLYGLVMDQSQKAEKYRPPGDWLHYRADPGLIFS